MKRRIILACALAALSTAGSSQNRLVPVEAKQNTLESYQSQVRTVFREAFSPEVKARVIVEPSFQPEVAIGLRERGNSFELFAFRPAQHIWQYQLLEMMKNGQIQTLGPSGKSKQQADIDKLEASLPKRIEQIRLDRCKVPVDQATSSTILSVWSLMLNDIHADDELPFGTDGESYYFSMPSDHGELVGQAWSPRQDSRVGKFIRMSFAMKDFCERRRTSDLGAVMSLAHQIIKETQEDNADE